MRPTRPRWYLTCQKSADGTYAARAVLRLDAQGRKPDGRGWWISEADHARDPHLYHSEFGRRYRNRAAAERAARRLMARFPIIRLELTHEYKKPDPLHRGAHLWMEHVWAIGLHIRQERGSE